jgi:hypothetical protein
MPRIQSQCLYWAGGDIYPDLGGNYPGNFAGTSTQNLATNVTSITVPSSRHWIPEEQQNLSLSNLQSSSTSSFFQFHHWSYRNKRFGSGHCLDL